MSQAIQIIMINIKLEDRTYEKKNYEKLSMD